MSHVDLEALKDLLNQIPAVRALGIAEVKSAGAVISVPTETVTRLGEDPVQYRTIMLACCVKELAAEGDK